MAIEVFNSLRNRKERYEPLRSDLTGFYLCGPTVYNYFHIGNARPFIVFDVIRRYLIYRGYHVRFVMNLTDIDDRIIQRANADGVSSDAIAQKYITAFFEDMQRLAVRPADVYPRATEHVDDIIALIRRLEEKGISYVSGGDVFFDVEKFPKYTQLSGKNLEQLQAGARIAVDERKRNPLDFVLWKASKPGEPKWESPWGAGRPGWHIECSAMSMKYLGESFDFHAGGQDLIFPHHENEIAQSEAATGKEFVRYWLHNGFLDIHGEKMAKSAGNFITARKLVRQYPVAAIRLFFLQKHYRSPIDFSDEALQAAATASARLAMSFEKISEVAGDALPLSGSDFADASDRQKAYFAIVETLHTEIGQAMDDDFNSPNAVGKIFDLVRETNRFIDAGIDETFDRRLVARAFFNLEGYDTFLGIFENDGKNIDSAAMDRVLQVILKLRQQLRHEKNYLLADQVRNGLGDAGVIIEDSPLGPTWRWK